jgi:heme-degrading monooxygenase HmoA
VTVEDANQRNGGQMLVRSWEGRTRAGAEAKYLAFLTDVMVPKIRSLPGNLGAQVLKGHTDSSRFVVLSYWVDLESIERFSGSDPEHAVVPPEARALLADFDERARHYDVVLEHRPGPA